MGTVSNSQGGGSTTVSPQSLADGGALAPGATPANGSQLKLLADSVTNLAAMVAKMNAGLGLDTAAMAALAAAASPSTQQVAGSITTTFNERTGTRSAVTVVAVAATTAVDAFAADATGKRFEATVVNQVADILYVTLDGTTPSSINYHTALAAKGASVGSQTTLYGDDAALRVRVLSATAGSILVHSKVAP